MTTVSEMCVNAIRGLLVADDGCKLVVADLSNIEGRVAAWLAGEEWKLQAFRDFDTILGHDEKGEPIRKGHDLYKIGAGRILGKRPEDVTKLERQNEGKVPELACAYGGAVGAFTTMGANFGVVLPEDRVVEIVKAWRKQHPRIVSTWYAIEDAAKAAIRFPDESFEVNGMLRFDSVNGWLRIRMPSGTYLSYPNAQVGTVCARCEGTGKHLETGVANATKMVVCLDCDGTGKSDTQIRYDGVDQYTKKWGVIRSYGAKFFENSIQKIARDVFMHGFARAEEHGYAVVARVHDELITEVPDTPEYTAAELSALMATNPSWSVGLPLAAAGHEMKRYAKLD